ncbi:hypothetical protein [Nocardioides perillae]|uniref:Uncharacterized protein n=1 Tax=Nocardioides perillae TaxID=1119534 RepID=A0A7Y9UNN6_9ACTN|nr:hypothetical protein [Nocardioides perillae]NYG56666.1 hypothetical protein [Nocardioides perillae]
MSTTALPVVPLHLGDLHAYEQLLVLLLAFGPFAVLGVVVAVLRRRDLAAEDETADAAAVDGADEAGSRSPGTARTQHAGSTLAPAEPGEPQRDR